MLLPCCCNLNENHLPTSINTSFCCCVVFFAVVCSLLLLLIVVAQKNNARRSFIRFSKKIQNIGGSKGSGVKAGKLVSPLCVVCCFCVSDVLLFVEWSGA